MALALLWDGDKSKDLLDALRRADPAVDVRMTPDLAPREDITFIVTWAPPPGELASYPRLKGVSSIAVGYDGILADPLYPDGVPLARIVDPVLSTMIAHYVIYAVLRHVRGMEAYHHGQGRGIWHRQDPPPCPGACRIGIMGLGSLGCRTADLLSGLGFDVAGWARTHRDSKLWTCFHGPDARDAFLARSDVLVCMLPLTPRTRGILNASLFKLLPKGACLINVGRGAHLVEEDLIEALDRGNLGSACLDVFVTEPLPQGHPFWSHPRITITPHAAGTYEGYLDHAASQIMQNYHRSRQGLPLLNEVQTI